MEVPLNIMRLLKVVLLDALFTVHVPAPETAPSKNNALPLAASYSTSELFAMPPLKVIAKLEEGANFSVPALTVVKPV